MCEANCGLKLNDVVHTKFQWSFVTSLPYTNYIIKYLCNGIVGIQDVGKPDSIPHFNMANNLTKVGELKKCIQFKDKNLCLT